MIKGDAIFSTLRSLLGSFQFFILSVFVIKFSSLANWGGFINSYLIWSFFVMTINSGSKEFLLKQISKKPANKWPLVSNNAWLRILLNLPAFLIILFLPSIVTIEKPLMVLIIILRVFVSTFESIIVYEKAFKESFLIELFSFCFLFVFLLCALYLNALEPLSILICLIVTDFIKLLMYNRIFGFGNNFMISNFKFFEQFSIVIPFLTTGIIGLIMNKADLYIFGIFVKDNVLIAEYHILNTLSNLFLVTISAIILVRSKVLFRVSLAKFKYIQRVYSFYSFCVIIIGLTMFYFLSPLLFQYPVKFKLLIIIGLSTLFFSGYILNIYLHMRFDKLKIVNIIIAIGGFFSIIANLLLIPILSIEGALIAVLIANSIIFVGMKYTCSKYFI